MDFEKVDQSLMQLANKTAGLLGLQPLPQGSESDLMKFFASTNSKIGNLIGSATQNIAMSQQEFAFNNIKSMTPEELAQNMVKGLLVGFDPSKNLALQTLLKIFNPEEQQAKKEGVLQKEEGQEEPSLSEDEDEEESEEQKLEKKLKSAEDIIEKKAKRLDPDTKKGLQETQASTTKFKEKPTPGGDKSAEKKMEEERKTAEAEKKEGKDQDSLKQDDKPDSSQSTSQTSTLTMGGGGTT